MPQFSRDPGFLVRPNRPESLDVEQWLREQNIEMERVMRPLTQQRRAQKRFMSLDEHPLLVAPQP